MEEIRVPPVHTPISAIKPLFKIFGELRPHGRLIAANQGICLLTLAIGFSIPFLLKWLTEQIQAGRYEVLVWVPGVGFFFVVAFAAIQLLRSLVAQYITIRISQGLQKRILKHFLDDDVLDYFNRPMGEKVSRMTFDIHWFVEGAAIFLSETLYLPLVVIGCIGIMVHLDWRMALVTILVSPLSLLVNRPFARKLRRSSLLLQQQNALLSKHIIDTLKGLLLIKVFAKEEQENRQFDGLLDRFIRMQIENNFWGGLFRMTIMVGNALVICIVCWLAFYFLTGAQGLTVATFVAFSSAMLYFFGEIAKIGSIMNTLVKTAVSCERIFSLLEEKRPATVAGREPAGFSRDLCLEGVDFAYQPGATVLEQVDFRLARGENIALIGMSGAGKTTFIHLLLGLLSPGCGRITLDGRAMADYDPKSWRQLFGYSPQQNVLFYMSIADNIAYSRPEAGRQEIIRAAEIACADEFIQKLPNGYDTLVDESGANLSEGQRQRIALARAIVRDAPIIILDETSAHVDLLTERKIYENIMALEGKTVIIVSHRPSVLQAADTIYSIAGGRLTRVGSFGEFEEKLGHGELLRAMEFIH